MKIDEAWYEYPSNLVDLFEDSYKKFKDRPPEHINKFIQAFAALGGAYAFDYLKSLTSKMAFFSSSKEERLKYAAINAMGFINDSNALSFLTKTAKGKNKKMGAAAVRSLASRKKRMQ